MIINNLALMINDLILNLYNNGIYFYQILIGLFIANFSIYYICYMLKKINKIKW